ncbi:rhodanese [Bacillus sp. FJAT-27225]|uniref:rhodanese-like domain-containing protein n=1 Tax=Bacillus sp. FJAT-27225 TaxID=1743144 RepID=UPI00080C278A|nr:rhodanese-like domain-containing protein [Bacillus sp. FJAT-27225]OCA83179.1 rhodanese [Bacillus sp. FJAT-27225]
MEEISPKEVQALLTEGKALNIIDVREVDEVAAGRILGSVNIPLGLVEFRKQDLEKSKEYIIVCHSGGRSARAAHYLESQGFKVRNLSGGMLAWEGKVE